ncbi:MAG: hypothetical protein ABSC64_10185 [Candidatus Korobacteraceae bacterium]
MRGPKTALGRATWRAEWFLAISLATCFVFAVAGKALQSDLANPFVLAFVFFWLFGVILGPIHSHELRPFLAGRPGR